MLTRPPQVGNGLLLSLHQFVEVLHLVGEVPHLMTPEEEDVGLVDGVELVAVQLVFLDDDVPQLARLFIIGS